MTFETKDSGERQVFSTGMNRDVAKNKARYDLVYLPMLTRWAELMQRGAVKYTARNWEKASTQEELDRFKESAFRHFIQWFNGELDEDHAAAVFFNISGAEMVRTKHANAQRDSDALSRRIVGVPVSNHIHTVSAGCDADCPLGENT